MGLFACPLLLSNCDFAAYGLTMLSTISSALLITLSVDAAQSQVIESIVPLVVTQVLKQNIGLSATYVLIETPLTVAS